MLTQSKVALAILLLLAGIISPALADQPFAFATTPGRLPKNVIPRHYSIRIEPNLEHFSTRGQVSIDVEVTESVKEIVLNALGIEVTKASLSGSPEMVLRPRLDLGKQIVTLKLPKSIAPGKYRLSLEFTGQIGEQPEGLYYARYTTPTGKKTMLATQMEPAGARRFFPCWDEPAFRATYELTALLPEKFKAVSNMPIESEKTGQDGWKEVHFMNTPPMPSYLVALVAGELEELRGESEGVHIRIITTEGKREQGQYALEATQKLLTYYNDYFHVKYPLPKLDQIAIPGGFEGAMENWGAITYNESVLLYDPKTSSQRTRREIFVDVAHEMAHQWFGNLVTTAWWDNLWLNEGFATWMENKATDHFNPSWQMWLNASADKSAVMGDDARRTTHPIQQRVEDEDGANDAFDDITYLKGGAFLRMLEDYLGPDIFRDGVRRYLYAHLYSNATTADLWNALEEVSGKPVRALAAGWTEQPGLPLVKIKADCVNGKQIVTLEQERFTVQDPHASSLQWKIPVTLAKVGNGSTNIHTLLQNKPMVLSFRDCDTALKVNAGDAGYYRVQYAPALFERLQQSFHFLPEADRLNFLNDTWALVEAGRSSSTNYFNLIKMLNGETTPAIWNQIIATFYLVDALERNQPGRDAFRSFARAKLQPQLQRLGWERQPTEPFTQSLLRNKIISALGSFGDPSVIAEARARFQNFWTAPETLSPDLRPTVVTIAGRYSDLKTYDQIHELALRATGTEERHLYYGALCAAIDPELAQSTLSLSLTDELAKREAADLVIEIASGEQKELAWSFAAKNMKSLLGKLDSFSRNVYVPSIFHSFSDADRANELEDYVKKNISAAALPKAREAAENIRLKAALKQREIPVIDNWVKSHSTDLK